MYECTEDLDFFNIKGCNEDGFRIENHITVRKGSQWEIDSESDIIGCHGIGGEIHLDNVDGTQWIEISKETLNRYFKEKNATDDRMEVSG